MSRSEGCHGTYDAREARLVAEHLPQVVLVEVPDVRAVRVGLVGLRLPGARGHGDEDLARRG